MRARAALPVPYRSRLKLSLLKLGELAAGEPTVSRCRLFTRLSRTLHRPLLISSALSSRRDGRAELTALSLRGAPRTVFGMAVTAGEGPIALTAAFNVSVAACDPIEVYNPGTGQCQCLAGFVASNVTGARAACRCPSGYNFVEAGQAGSPPSCRLPPTRRFGRLTDAAFIGIVVGSFVFLLCALTLGASEFSKRKERQLWQDELASEKELLRALQSRLAAADGESDVADSSLDMLRKLYPLATGIALAIFAEGGIPEVSLCKTHAVTGAGSKALQSSLPVAAKPGAGKPGAGASCAATEAGSSQDGSMSRRSVVAGSTSTLSVVVELSKGGKGVAMRGTSVEWVNERQTLADSRDFTDGVRAFPDWAAAAGRGGLKSQRAVTAPITAGPVTLGVVVLHFQTSRPGRAERSLLEFCKAVGGALFVRRTLVGLVYDSNAQPSDANTGREFGNSSLRSGFPVSSRKQSASGRSFLSSQLPTLDDTAAWDKLDAEGPAMRARLTAWNLDAWQINTEELCLLAVRVRAFVPPPHHSLRSLPCSTCAHPSFLRPTCSPLLTHILRPSHPAQIHMFHSLGLVRRFSIRVALLQEFLEEVASHYWDNPFHNYRHAWTVAHTAWRFASMSAELQGMLHDLDKLVRESRCVCLIWRGKRCIVRLFALARARPTAWAEAKMLSPLPSAPHLTAVRPRHTPFSPVLYPRRCSSAPSATISSTQVRPRRSPLSKQRLLPLLRTPLTHARTSLPPADISLVSMIGTTNAFQINTGSDLALVYNDVHVLARHTAPLAAPQSCVPSAPPPSRLPLLLPLSASSPHCCRPPCRLSGTAYSRLPPSHPFPPPPPNDSSQENHHAHVLFQLLEETKVLSHLPLADRKLLRKLMVDAILSTDMAQHKDLVARVQKHGNGELPPLRAELIDDRLVLVSLLLHCADLHTPTLEPHISKRVADSLSDEFEAQADTERAAGLQVTVMLPSANQSKAALVRRERQGPATSRDRRSRSGEEPSGGCFPVSCSQFSSRLSVDLSLLPCFRGLPPMQEIGFIQFVVRHAMQRTAPCCCADPYAMRVVAHAACALRVFR